MKSIEEYLQGSQPVLIEFYATWSESCKLMNNELQQVKDRACERMIVIKKDIEEYSDFIERYAIHSIPTLLLFKAGKIIWRKNGFAPAHEILDQLSAATANQDRPVQHL